jgi:pyridinium-3,5-biscarboxylic acid mononucleotide sulfurtransferase
VSRVAELEVMLARFGSAVVAFSGGVDSSLVACLAARALGDRSLAVTAVSPALAEGELEKANAVAVTVGIAHEWIATDELARPGYAANGRDRCYHCKTELYERLSAIAGERGYAVVVSGANADDLGDWRPGLRAAAEYGVRHVLLEAGVGKDEVRQLARELGVPTAEKPASPCLASRLPYGTPVERETLALIDRAERGVRALGYRVLRVRHHGDLGRVEIGSEELPRAVTPSGRAAIVAAVSRAGYARVEVADRPFRSGSLNILR